MAQHCPVSISRPKVSYPEGNLLAANEDTRLDEGGVCKPIVSSLEGRGIPRGLLTTTEQQREGHAGSQMLEETTTRRLPDAWWDEQEEVKSTDRPA
ncbi:hypothetical protein NDU88_002042 [Pleurodeles waltl]|uniref:Uncharacterized protein n=1 Tax=Pleurodeles waltl TaxID=8319 RepID=A0AAV7WMC9_PLEWA|nr:hypothetical protein NDU88_002042 [Pleurodeles waltl]